MRVVVTGATGNVGTSVLDALGSDPWVNSIVAVARRIPTSEQPACRRWAQVEWLSADVVTSDLETVFAGADAVVHLAWLVQPSHRPDLMRATNIDGSERVFAAAAEAGVASVIYASSAGAYSPGPRDRCVDENWPTGGVPSSIYGLQKAEVERALNRFEAANPAIRVVRLRPGLTLKREAASGIRRLFLGSHFPARLLRPGRIPVVPCAAHLAFQAVHTSDVAEAYRLAVTTDVRGAFNVTADPVLSPLELGRVLDARPLPIARTVLRVSVDLSWRLRLQPTPPGWVDLAFSIPLLDSSRARQKLGWSPRWSSGGALRDLLGGFAERASGPTPALAHRAPRI